MISDEGSDCSVINTPLLELPGTSRSADEKQSVGAVDPEKKETILLPVKKRPYVTTFKETDEMTRTPLKIIIAKQKYGGMKVIPGVSCDHSLNRCSSSDKKTHKPIAATSAPEAPIKSGRKTGKKDTQGASTSFSAEAERTAAATAGTSVATSIGCTDRSFWIEMAESNFSSSKYHKLLMDSEFTELQSNALQETVSRLSRRFSNIIKNRDRYRKTHKCRDCGFSISHLCVSINFLHANLFNMDMLDESFIMPEKTVTCICHFAFFHIHTTTLCGDTVDSPSPRVSSRFEEHDRVGNFVCLTCQTDVSIEHCDKEGSCYLTNWTDLDSSNHHKDFYNSVETFTQHRRQKKPYLEELHSCSNGCCLFFHRCASKPSADKEAATSPSG